MAETAHATSLLEPIVLLATAVVAVPLAKRIGLGSVLGYIAAGIAIGPFALGLFAGARPRLRHRRARHRPAALHHRA